MEGGRVTRRSQFKGCRHWRELQREHLPPERIGQGRDPVPIAERNGGSVGGVYIIRNNVNAGSPPPPVSSSRPPPVSSWKPFF